MITNIGNVRFEGSQATLHHYLVEARRYWEKRGKNLNSYRLYLFFLYKDAAK